MIEYEHCPRRARDFIEHGPLVAEVHDDNVSVRDRRGRIVIAGGMKLDIIPAEGVSDRPGGTKSVSAILMVDAQHFRHF